MEIDKNGRKLIYDEEGVRLKAYFDQVGVITIGVGFTYIPGSARKIKITDTITQKECDEIFDKIIIVYQEAVNKAIKVKLTQNQFNALVSLCFNIGCAAFAGSTLVKKINSKAGINEIEKWFLAWCKAGGKPILLGRRKREFTVFKS